MLHIGTGTDFTMLLEWLNNPGNTQTECKISGEAISSALAGFLVGFTPMKK
jgi:hypothetical protein